MKQGKARFGLAATVKKGVIKIKSVNELIAMSADDRAAYIMTQPVWIQGAPSKEAG